MTAYGGIPRYISPVIFKAITIHIPEGVTILLSRSGQATDRLLSPGWCLRTGSWFSFKSLHAPCTREKFTPVVKGRIRNVTEKALYWNSRGGCLDMKTQSFAVTDCNSLWPYGVDSAGMQPRHGPGGDRPTDRNSDTQTSPILLFITF